MIVSGMFDTVHKCYLSVQNPLDTNYGDPHIEVYGKVWTCMFPILSPPCFPVHGFELEEVEGGVFRLWWDSVGDSVQVELVSDTVNHTPVSGIYTTDTTALLDLGADVEYYVRIRRRCPYGEDKWSQWSEYMVVSPDTAHHEVPEAGIRAAEGLAFTLTPNPTRRTVKVSAAMAEAGVLCMVDMAGRRVMSRTVEASEWPLVVDVGRLPRGTYTVSLATAKAMAVKRLLLK